MSTTKTNGYRRRTDKAPRRIVSTRIMIQWNDKPKEEVSYHDMPNDLADQYDDWLALIEAEENAKNGL
jgi:hypothetical protein|tara:strand:- start:244 stop:447 length:204 start_codon:yes stop_codon:yes gene_type:complete